MVAMIIEPAVSLKYAYLKWSKSFVINTMWEENVFDNFNFY